MLRLIRLLLNIRSLALESFMFHMFLFLQHYCVFFGASAHFFALIGDFSTNGKNFWNNGDFIQRSISSAHIHIESQPFILNSTVSLAWKIRKNPLILSHPHPSTLNRKWTDVPPLVRLSWRWGWSFLLGLCMEMEESERASTAWWRWWRVGVRRKVSPPSWQSGGASCWALGWKKMHIEWWWGLRNKQLNAQVK